MESLTMLKAPPWLRHRPAVFFSPLIWWWWWGWRWWWWWFRMHIDALFSTCWDLCVSQSHDASQIISAFFFIYTWQWDTHKVLLFFFEASGTMTESDGCLALSLSLIVCCRQGEAIEEFAGQCWQSLPGPKISFRFADMRYWNIFEHVLHILVHFKRTIV